MCMHIDKPRQEGGVAKIEHLSVTGHQVGAPRTNLGDPAGLHDHGLRRAHLASSSIEQPGCPDDYSMVAVLHRKPR